MNTSYFPALWVRHQGVTYLDPVLQGLPGDCSCGAGWKAVTSEDVTGRGIVSKFMRVNTDRIRFLTSCWLKVHLNSLSCRPFIAQMKTWQAAQFPEWMSKRANEVTQDWSHPFFITQFWKYLSINFASFYSNLGLGHTQEERVIKGHDKK